MSNSKPIVLHLLPNAHLDPVWLWDWREGLNEGRITVRTILNLMDEFPELTFLRGESAIYEHIQKTDATLFRRILKMIEKGRWDVVGGTVIQPDSNLASTETLCREFERGLAYFKKNMGVRPTIAWQADSFSHTPGFPNILDSFGMNGFAFTRPQRGQFPMEDATFWWESPGKNRILCYRQYWPAYCSERGNLNEVLDTTLSHARKAEWTHAGVLFGLGNHGGGPTRRHLREVEKWREDHPEVEVRYSTLHGFFATVRKEISDKPHLKIPTVQGDLGYCLRGCYSSVQKFKSLYRQAESLVTDAEITRSIVATATKTEAASLDDAWHSVAFNAFHDILPGSSIERAFDEQSAWVGLALHRAQDVRFSALNLLADQINTTVPAPRHPDAPTDVPLLLWNSQPRPYKGQIELEAALDYRPNFAYKNRASELPVVVFDHKGKPSPFQIVQTENTSMLDVPWRKRVVVPVEIPAWGWTFFRLGQRDKEEAIPAKPLCRALGGKKALIANDDWKLEVKDGSLRIQRRGVNFFSGNRNFELRVVEDPWGSWGGMLEEPDSYVLNQTRETWSLAHHQVLEPGPLRAKLWTRWQGKNSWLDLTFSVSDTPWVKVEGRLLWNERSARLKLVLPGRGGLKYDVPGGSVNREAEGQVPGGRWVTRSDGKEVLGFASDVLSDFDATETELSVTLARASRYANDVKTAPTEKMWEPATDCGELKFQFCLFGHNVDADQVSDSLLFPPNFMVAPGTKGPWERKGSLGNLSPNSMRLLSLDQIAPGTLRVRLQNRGSKSAKATLQLGSERIQLGKLSPETIQTLVLKQSKGRPWRVLS